MSQYVTEHNEWTAHAHDDFSGNVVFTRANQADVEVPGELILKAVARYVARRRISAIERASEEELLGIPERRKASGG